METGRVEGVALPALGHPGAVAPVVGEVPHQGARARRSLVEEAVGIGLVDHVAAQARDEVVLVPGLRRGTADEPLPEPGAAHRLEEVLPLLPAVPVADHAHRLGVRRPDAERHARLPADRGRVRAQLPVGSEMRALVEEVQVLVAEDGVRDWRRARGSGHGSHIAPAVTGCLDHRTRAARGPRDGGRHRGTMSAWIGEGPAGRHRPPRAAEGWSLAPAASGRSRVGPAPRPWRDSPAENHVVPPW